MSGPSCDALADLVLVLLRRSNATMDLADLGAMHRALSDPTRQTETGDGGWPASTVRALGHVPDPVYGRRVPGLDMAVTSLESRGLIRHEHARWSLRSDGRRRAARLVLSLPVDAHAFLDGLTTAWARHRAIGTALQAEARQRLAPRRG